MFGIVQITFDERGIEAGRAMLLGPVFTSLEDARNYLAWNTERVESDSNPLTTGWTEIFQIVELSQIETKAVKYPA